MTRIRYAVAHNSLKNDFVSEWFDDHSLAVALLKELGEDTHYIMDTESLEESCTTSQRARDLLALAFPVVTRDEALQIAKANHTAHSVADIEHLFKGGPAFDAYALFGYRHGWYTVGGHSFNMEDITGTPYDALQGGWAYL